MSQQQQHESAVRLDKWLWAARFFKTRSLASEAIKGGKVHVNGHRVKPSKKIQLDDELDITQSYVERTIIVRGLSERRGPAKVAVTLYEETKDSISRREQRSQERKLVSAMVAPVSRPSKRDRRQIRHFKGRDQYE